MTTLAPLNLRDFPPVEVNIEPPETLSQTLMAKHNHCPRSAFYSRKYQTSSVQMDRGTAFHHFAQRATEVMIEQGEPIMPGEVAREMADAIMAEHKELVLPTEEQDAVRLMAWNWAEATVLDLEAIVGVEIPLEMEINGWRFTCRIDLLEVGANTLYPSDYKTSLNIRKKEDVLRGFQGQAYGLVLLDGVHRETKLSLGAGINDIWFWEKYPRYRTDEGPLIQREAVWSRSELAEFRGSLERNIEQFEESLTSGKWDARDGSWCAECPAPNECPIPAHLREVETVDTNAEAEDAFSQLMALEREKGRYQTTCREWVKETGQPIIVGDFAFDAKVETTRITDWDRIERDEEDGRAIRIDRYVSSRPSTKFAKRKLTEEERDAGKS